MTRTTQQRSKRNDQWGRNAHHDDTAGGPGTVGKSLWRRRLSSYLQRAQVSLAAGDTVDAEHNFQHADHYLRLINGSAA